MCNNCKNCKDQRKKCCVPDLTFTNTDDSLDPISLPFSLPLPLNVKQDCNFQINNAFFDSLQTLKKCRVLKVEGSVENGTLIISIQTGEETPRVFSFTNTQAPVESFTLVENLTKGDKISFSYQGVSPSVPLEPVIKLAGKIVKR